VIVTLEVANPAVFNFLREMENLNLVHLNTPLPAPFTGQEEGASTRFAGSLKVSSERYEEMQRELRDL
jgi:hypothetical protein